MFETTVTAITIETSSLRALSVRGDTIVAHAEMSLPPGVVIGGRVTDPHLVGQRLRELVQQHRLPTRRLVSCLPGVQTIARVLHLPPLPAAAVAGAVQSEARRQLHLALDTFSLTWQVLERRPDGLSIYLVAVPQDVLDSHLHTWHLARLRLAALDLKPLALARALALTTGVIANIEDDSLDLVLVVDHQPAIVRTIPLPSLATDLSLGMDIIVDEIFRTTKFYDDSHRDTPLAAMTPVVLAGSRAGEPAVATTVASRTGHPVVVGALPLGHAEALAPGAYVAAAGLVLKQGLGIHRRAA